jgi:DNA polymerase delta subunit 2
LNLGGVGSGAGDPLAAQMFTDWLSGLLGSPADQRLASRVVRCIVAGNAVAALPPPAGALGPREASRLTGPLRCADSLLAQLASALPVDLMPGPHDPSNAALPQQPLHPCLLPEAVRFEQALSRATNPHECVLAGARVLGTSGQNVDDLFRCTSAESRLDVACDTLAWGHLAPSAPDTLSCHPFMDRDPFLVGETPHVYFAGNQPTFASRLVHRGGTATRVVLVPTFASTGTLVLVELHTLAVHTISFATSALV